MLGLASFLPCGKQLQHKILDNWSILMGKLTFTFSLPGFSLLSSVVFLLHAVITAIKWFMLLCQSCKFLRNFLLKKYLNLADWLLCKGKFVSRVCKVYNKLFIALNIKCFMERKELSARGILVRFSATGRVTWVNFSKLHKKNSYTLLQYYC